LSCVSQFGITTEISHENYFVKGHEEPFFYWDFLNDAILLAHETRIKRTFVWT